MDGVVGSSRGETMAAWSRPIPARVAAGGKLKRGRKSNVPDSSSSRIKDEAVPCFSRRKKKKKRKALDTSTIPSPSFSTYFVIPRPCDSSRSSPKCLLGWKIARVLDDGRIDLSFETKGLLMNRVAEIGRTRGVLLLDRWIKGSCDVREHMGTYVEVTRVADSGNQEEKEILGEVWKFLCLTKILA